jgi:Arc/MetJ-type ribon-helix-helix transcriptional regulator
MVACTAGCRRCCRLPAIRGGPPAPVAARPASTLRHRSRSCALIRTGLRLSGSTTGMLSSMRTVEKVTVSLPAELLARIERRRQDRQTSRSQVVTELLWRGWRQVEDEERRERARAAYATQPETADELACADYAAEVLFHVGEAESSPTTSAAGPRTSRPGASPNGARSKKRSKATPSAPGPVSNIRSWAIENGFTIGNRGRIPSSVREAFDRESR